MNHHSQTIGLISDQLATEVFAGEAIRGSLATAVLQRAHAVRRRRPAATGRWRCVWCRTCWIAGSAGSSMPRSTPGGYSFPPCSVISRWCCSTVWPGHRASPPWCRMNRQGAERRPGSCWTPGIPTDLSSIGETPAQVLAGVERRTGIEEELRGPGVELAGPGGHELVAGAGLSGSSDELLDAGARPTALICLNDRIAFGAYQALSERGLSMPRRRLGGLVR